MFSPIYWIILLIIFLDFCFNFALQRLNIKASHNPVPKVLQGLYDEEKYARQQQYFRDNNRLALITNGFSFILTFSLFAFGLYGWFDGWVRSISEYPVVHGLLFFVVITLIETLISIPFSAYDTFVVEARYGFNKTTPLLFLRDICVSTLISLVLSCVLIGVCIWFYLLWPRWFWLYAWVVYAGFTILLQYFYSKIIVPLFNKQTPLPEGPLRTAIETFASKAGFRLKNIFVLDASKRSTKANAYFTGFGRKKRVVLYDTLIQQLETDEIVGVLAHEVGHYKHRHTLQNLLTALLQTLLLFWLFSLVIDSRAIASAACATEPSFWVNMMVFGLLLSPINQVVSVLLNIVSRRHERQADAFALHYGYGPAEASALKKIAAQALSNLTPHPAVVFCRYSHPTLAERVAYLQKGEGPDVTE